MKGSIAMEALLISAVAIFFLVFAGRAVQEYGAKFAEDVDRMAWIRQSVYKIYASVQMLETCEVGSADTLDVYVPESGEIELYDYNITGKVRNVNRKYQNIKDDYYEYSMKINTRFVDNTNLAPGWARIRLERTANGIKVEIKQMGLG